MSCTCARCGRKFPQPDGVCCEEVHCFCESLEHTRDPIANPCLHFVSFTGENIEAKDCGCQTAKPMTATAECELHGLCTVIQPAADDSIQCCQTCNDYSPSG